MARREQQLDDGGKLAALLFRRLGDSLLATPALRSLKQSFPKSTVQVICERQVSRVFEHLDYVDDVTVVSGSPGIKELVQAIRSNVRSSVATVDFLSDPRTSLASLISGATVRVGIAKSWRRFAYTRAVSVQDIVRPEYSAIHKLRLAESLGAGSVDCMPEFRLDEESIESAERIMKSLVSRDEGIVSIYVTSRRDYKKWPMEKFKQVVHTIRSGYSIALVGAVSEYDDIAQFCDYARIERNAITLFTDLGEFGAFLQKCILFVGNDGGPKHLATAVGTPTVGIFQNDPWEYWTPPNSNRHLGVGGRGVTPEVSDVMDAIHVVLSSNA